MKEGLKGSEQTKQTEAYVLQKSKPAPSQIGSPLISPQGVLVLLAELA